MFFDSSDSSLLTPDVVSSVPPTTFFILDLWAWICNSAPSSVIICGLHFTTLAIPSLYSLSVSPFQAKTFTPSISRNAAISSCTESGFAEHKAMSAPNCFAAITNTDVSFVMCKHNPIGRNIFPFVIKNDLLGLCFAILLTVLYQNESIIKFVSTEYVLLQ